MSREQSVTMGGGTLADVPVASMETKTIYVNYGASTQLAMTSPRIAVEMRANTLRYGYHFVIFDATNKDGVRFRILRS